MLHTWKLVTSMVIIRKNPPLVRKKTMNAWLNKIPIGEDSLPVPGFSVAPRLAPRWLSMMNPAASKIQNGNAMRYPITRPTKASFRAIRIMSIPSPSQRA
ncbi:hypothetical protein D3C72_1972400 [compost metagenome]